MTSAFDGFEYICLNVPADAAVRTYNIGVLQLLWWDYYEPPSPQTVPFCTEYPLLGYLQDNCGLVTVDWLETSLGALNDALETAHEHGEFAREQAEMQASNALSQLQGQAASGLPALMIASLERQIEAQTRAATRSITQQTVKPLKAKLSAFERQYGRLMRLPTRIVFFRRPLDLVGGEELRLAEATVAEIAYTRPVLPGPPILNNPLEPEMAEYGRQYEISFLVISGLALAFSWLAGLLQHELLRVRAIGYIAFFVVAISAAVLVGRRVRYWQRKAEYRRLQAEDVQRMAAWRARCRKLLEMHSAQLQSAVEHLNSLLRG